MWMLLQTLLWLAPAAPQTPAEVSNQRAEAVAALLQERCFDCHDPENGKRKAIRKWADARDLAATVIDPDLIIPGDPAGSELYASVEFDDMPPPESDGEPLSDAEKALIAAWISDGAPVPLASDPEGTEAVVEGPEAAVEGLGGTEPPPTIEPDPVDATLPETAQVPPLEPAAQVAAPEETKAPPSRAPKSGWLHTPLLRWSGRFHPIVVHFPIALLVAALLAELGGKLGRLRQSAATSEFCLWLGALGSLPAAGLGWALGANGSYHAGELDWHRWLGVATAALSLLALFVFRRYPKLRLPGLFLLAVLVGITGHLGGELTYGDDWLNWPG
ncbi:MAG: hypothetical protein H6830_07250 [Planctomycetes bacterium]|nr:hypothetical protein [Planctomycetota bacterium]MCB9911427.1 hypothetical protein [Planctomycetota bacterium]